MRQHMLEAMERLILSAEDEAVAFLQMGLSQIDNWTTDYVALEADLLRMQKSAGNKRVIIPVRKMEDPDVMAIYGDENYPHHKYTDNARINELRRRQELSLRKRQNDNSSSKKNRFSSISN